MSQGGCGKLWEVGRAHRRRLSGSAAPFENKRKVGGGPDLILTGIPESGVRVNAPQESLEDL